MMSPSYPKRLIEVDLPIKKISEHARREKSIRHGHISTLHIWWARRPLAACRAVICAALWPDPADPLCPESFKIDAKKLMGEFWNQMDKGARNLDDPVEVRKALLDFIAEFANWDNSTNERYLNTARALTQSAHEGLGGAPGTRPLVVDPFAGGGSIPLEALRVGADVYASDLNPVAALLNKVVLEYIPKYGQELADEVRKWGRWVMDEAEKELAEYYPKDPDGSTPIAYLWARTITCEGPGCGAEVPLIRSTWLANKSNRSVALRLIPNPTEKRVDFAIIPDAKAVDVKDGTVRRGSVTCPCCGYTTPVVSVRRQLKPRHGGTDDARMFCVVTTSAKTKGQGRFYRLPTQRDLDAVRLAKEELERRKREWTGDLSLVPDEPTPIGGGSGAGRAFSQRNYGMDKFEDMFTSRQLLALTTLVRIVQNAEKHFSVKGSDNGKIRTIHTCLSLSIDKFADSNSGQVWWMAKGEKTVGSFSRQAISMIWDFGEIPFSDAPSRNFIEAVEWMIKIIEHISKISYSGINGMSSQHNACNINLPNDLAAAFVTDPPYYDAVPYADLSDFFYIWLKRSLPINEIKEMFVEPLSPKKEECILDEIKGMTKDYFENTMQKAMIEGKRSLSPMGIGIVVFANKTTEGWEAQLQAMINAGWIILGSWPIDTERQVKLNTINRAFLGSSIHIVCRPRENLDGFQNTENIGEWSDILAELPIRIREWMPRLKQENVVGADAIFACLGPALEIFSRYSRVEKVSGEQVTLKEYLEKIWEAVEKEALIVIFEGADASGFEEDARLTAMWLWTLKGGSNGDSALSTIDNTDNESEDDADESQTTKPIKVVGYALEYDAARKISQGLGAHLESMQTLIEIKKGKARLLSITERASYLFGKQDLSPKRKLKKYEAQLTLFPVEVEAEEPAASSSLGELSTLGKTTLDRVHQSMLLFGNGQSEALKKFLIEDGVGKDAQFKKLAQALVALYPTGSDEKRWTEGVMSRMKGLGL